MEQRLPECTWVLWAGCSQGDLGAFNPQSSLGLVLDCSDLAFSVRELPGTTDSIIQDWQVLWENASPLSLKPVSDLI